MYDKSMPLHMASAVGIPAKTAWSTTARQRTAAGDLYVVAGFSGSESAPKLGREFVSWLEKNHFSQPAQAYQAFKDYWQELSQQIGVSIAAVWHQDGDQPTTNVTLFSFGFGLIGVLKKDSAKWLIDGEVDEQALEGSLQPGDRLILATARAKTATPSIELWLATKGEDIAAELSGRFIRLPESAELAYLILENPLGTGSVNSDIIGSDQTKIDNQTEQSDQPKDVNQQFVGEAARTELTQGQTRLAGINQKTSIHLISPEKIAAGLVAKQTTETSEDLISTKPPSTKRWQQWLITHLKELRVLRIAVVLILVGGVIGGLFLWREQNAIRENREVVVPLEQKVEEVLAIAPENKIEIRDASKSLLERLQGTRVKYRRNRQTIVELTTKVEEIYQNSSGEREVVELPVFYDFRLAVANFLASKAGIFQDQASFLDSNEGKIIILNLSTKNNRTVTSENLKDAIDISTLDNRDLILRRENLLFVSHAGDSEEELESTADIGEPVALETFGTNAYILDRGKQQIWRVDLSGQSTASTDSNETDSEDAGSDSSLVGWVRSAAGINFAEVASLSIDGDIWLGTNQGEVFRLSRGEKVGFSIKGLLEPLTSTVLVATVSDGEKLVLVEPGSNRLIVLDKDGVYQQQVVAEQIGGVTDVFLNEDETSAFLTAGSVVYEVKL